MPTDFPPAYVPPTNTSTVASAPAASNEAPPSYNERAPSRDLAHTAPPNSWPAEKKGQDSGALGEYLDPNSDKTAKHAETHAAHKAGSSHEHASPDSGSKHGFFKSVKDGFVNKLGMHELGTRPEDNADVGANQLLTLFSGGVIVQGPSESTKKRMEAEAVAKHDT